MTLPIMLSLHVIYGVAMAFAMERRMRSEGEVLGLPLLLAILPVALVTTPLSAVLVRWSGAWYLHGVFLGQGSLAYERFHLGLMMGIGVAFGMAAAFGLVFAIAFLSRDARRLARIPAGVAAAVIVVVVALDPRGALFIPGKDAFVFAHPAGFVSLAVLLALVASWMFARARLSQPLELR